MPCFHKTMPRLLSRTQTHNFFPLTRHLYHSLSQNPGQIITTHLSNCTNTSQLNQIHAHVIRTHFLHFYSAPFYWNTIIRCYARLDHSTKALHVFVSMLRALVLPDCYTIPIAMKCVCSGFHFLLGMQVHAVAVKGGLDCNEFCESGFINLYAKGGDFVNARKVFEQNCERKLGSWNAIIGGLAQGGRAKEAIDMFIEMMKCGFRPDDVTMVSVTSACGSLGNLELGFQLHKCTVQAQSFEKSSVLMMNSLIDMYGKCGRMDLAYNVFCAMEERNVSSWTSMIVGHATQGHITDALQCFQSMKEEGVKPNHVTFIGILSACVHGGMVKEGKHYFYMMKNVYRIMPKLQHYGCMVDLLGKAGLFDEAREMIETMPIKTNSVIWGSLMGACEKHENVEMGEYVARHLSSLEPWNDGVYVVLSNIYASRGLWKEVERIRGFMKDSKLAKVPAYSLSTFSQ